MKRPEKFNGPGYEPRNVDLPEHAVYCVQCGTIFIWGKERDCPTCALAKKLEHLQEKLEEEENVS